VPKAKKAKTNAKVKPKKNVKTKAKGK